MRNKQAHVVLVTNIPAPYRTNVYELLREFDTTILFCSQSEPNRSWQHLNFKFKYFFLAGKIKQKSDGFNFIHNNPSIWTMLTNSQPEIIITTGFNPTHIYAFLWAKLHGAKHICMTDGTLSSESALSWKHKIIRKLVFRGTNAFIAASQGGIQLYASYEIPRERIFKSQLCAMNDNFSNENSFSQREFDVLFSGQFHERKLPFLFVEVCKRLKETRKNFRALLIGDGPLRHEVLNALTEAGIGFHYPGFVQQNELPKYYSNAKVLLFTTRMDPWGVVANEAMAAGTPVITTPFAGVAGELVIDGLTGAVCEPDPEAWTAAALRLLDDPKHWAACSANARKQVEGYNYKAAAEGIEAACRFVLEGN